MACASQHDCLHPASSKYADSSKWAVLLMRLSCNSYRQCPWGSYQPKTGQCGCLPCTGIVSADHTQCCEYTPHADSHGLCHLSCVTQPSLSE